MERKIIMNKKEMNSLFALLMVLVLGMMSFSSIAKAVTPTETVIYSGFVNGVERKIILSTSDNRLYLKIGDEETHYCSGNVALDKYGALWQINSDTLMWTSYEIMSRRDNDDSLSWSSLSAFLGYSNDVECFIFEGSGSQAIAVGFKTLDGESHFLPTFDEMKFMAGVGDISILEPSYIPSPISSSPTETPVEPSTTSGINSKVSIKKSNSMVSIYEGDTLISSFTLKKGSLTWNMGKNKTKHYKDVKYAAFIEKSKNLILVTKKGAVDIVSFKNGKKKRILKKDAKKIVYSNGFGIKIKTTSKTIDIRNR